jgi:hypothetical protein
VPGEPAPGTRLRRLKIPETGAGEETVEGNETQDLETRSETQRRCSIMEIDFNATDFVPLMVMAIPIVAITGGIIAGILRTMGRQRIIELAQRERIAAIERGIDPSRLPPLPSFGDENVSCDGRDHPRRLYHGLLIGGIITLAVGLAPIPLFCFDGGFRFSHNLGVGLGAMSLIPAAVGAGLIISALLVRPRNGGGRNSGGYPGPQDPPSPM